MTRSILVIEGEREDLVRLRKYIHQTMETKDCMWDEGYRNFFTPRIPNGFAQLKPLLDLALQGPCGVCLKRPAAVGSRMCDVCKDTPPQPVNRR